jgi:hypothetical protein
MAMVAALIGARFGSGSSSPSSNRVMKSVQRLRPDVMDATTLSNASPLNPYL